MEINDRIVLYMVFTDSFVIENNAALALKDWGYAIRMGDVRRVDAETQIEILDVWDATEKHDGKEPMHGKGYTFYRSDEFITAIKQ